MAAKVDQEKIHSFLQEAMQAPNAQMYQMLVSNPPRFPLTSSVTPDNVRTHNAELIELGKKIRGTIRQLEECTRNNPSSCVDIKLALSKSPEEPDVKHYLGISPLSDPNEKNCRLNAAPSYRSQPN